MIACYAPDVEFSDPVFPALKGEESLRPCGGCSPSSAKDLRLGARVSGIDGDDTSGKAHWEAYYIVSRRPVG